MNNYCLYDLKNYIHFEKYMINLLKRENFIVMCIGTNKYFKDSFGPLVGDKLKSIKRYVFGSSVREIAGGNFLQVYNYIKQKFPAYKILIIDSFYCLSNKKPILFLKSGGINVSGLNCKFRIGDYGILFNSFSYNNMDYLDKIIYNLTKTFLKQWQNN